MTNRTTSGKDQLLDYLSKAETIVREGGAIARELFGKVDIVGDHGQGNMFTEGDLAVNEHVCRRIQQAFPDHGILSEESGHQGEGQRHQWVLDPIDGTRYFHVGVPLYSISLALQVNGKSAIGIVYNPETDQLFSSVTGKGATLNGTAIRCSKKNELRDATVCLEIPHRRMPQPIRDAATHALTSLMAEVERVRVLGASALGLCYCANGAFDLYLSMSTGSKEWDVAAGKLILREAGANIAQYGDYTAGGPANLLDQLLHKLPSVTAAR